MEALDFNFEKKFRDLTLEHLRVLAERDRAFDALGRLESLCRTLHHENEVLKGIIQSLKMQRNDCLSENERLKIKLNKMLEELELERCHRKLCEENLKYIQKIVQESTKDLRAFHEVVVQFTSDSVGELDKWRILNAWMDNA